MNRLRSLFSQGWNFEKGAFASRTSFPDAPNPVLKLKKTATFIGLPFGKYDVENIKSVALRTAVAISDGSEANIEVDAKEPADGPWEVDATMVRHLLYCLMFCLSHIRCS